MNCPGCTLEMTASQLEGRYGQPLEIDVCAHCNGLWFDGRESLMLSARATLELFKLMAARKDGARAPAVAAKACPRCTAALVETHDMIKGGRYTYFACSADGRFMTFFQFMREKGFVRSPNPKELANLIATVKEVHCSNCGAQIPLEKTQTCLHCAAPVSILSKETIEQQLKTLHAQATKAPPSAQLLAAQLEFSRTVAESAYAKEHGPGTSSSLVGSIGLDLGADLVLGGLRLFLGW